MESREFVGESVQLVEGEKGVNRIADFDAGRDAGRDGG
jgi:hypothetical protein